MAFPRHIKREIFRYRYEKAVKEFGDEFPKTRAFFGRFLYFAEQTAPEGDIETVAWHRAGDYPGFMNRTQRRKYAHTP